MALAKDKNLPFQIHRSEEPVHITTLVGPRTKGRI